MTGSIKDRPRTRKIPILLAAALSVAVLTGAFFPASALAITRQQVIARGMVWVSKRVPYSQTRHYRGYRQDCAGFVSMAWQTKRSYTTNTLRSVSNRITKNSLRAGDAVISPGRGHAVVFVRWADRSHVRFVALEEPNRRIGHAVRRVTTWRRGSMALRRKGIRNAVPRPAVRRAPVPAPLVAPPPIPAPETIVAAEPTASVEVTTAQPSSLIP